MMDMKTTTVQLWAGVLVGIFVAGASISGEGQRDFSQVQITTTQIADSVYTLDGQGGRIGVLAGPRRSPLGGQPVRTADREDRGGRPANLECPYPVPD